MENKMLFTELKEISFEKEKEGGIEIEWYEDVDYSDELKCNILISTGEPLNGKYHFTDFKQICYFKNGKQHRDDNLPAEVWENGSLFYYVDWIEHRIDGPAHVYSKGGHEWYINGYGINNEEMDNWLIENNIPLDWNTWTESDKFYFALHWSDYNGEE